MAQAHVKLCEGQGAELRWSQTRAMLTPLEAMQVYALKTAPAFEAALYAGVRMAGPAEPYEAMMSQFCRHVGVGFQILNDLQDWHEHNANKVRPARDAEDANPTLLMALVAEAADSGQRARLDAIISGTVPAHERADLAEEVRPVSLRQLLHFLTDTILAQESSEPPIASSSIAVVPLSLTLPVPVAHL